MARPRSVLSIEPRTFRHSQGYILEYRPGHPRAHNNYVYQHILAWLEAGQELPDQWQIHHKNGVKDDNRLENLEAVSTKQHHKVHHGPESEIRRIAAVKEANRKRIYHRKTHCNRNHLLSEENVYVDKHGGRHCIQCMWERRPTENTPVPPHGTNARYRYHRCRCAECRAVNAATELDRRRRREAEASS